MNDFMIYMIYFHESMWSPSDQVSNWVPLALLSVGPLSVLQGRGGEVGEK